VSSVLPQLVLRLALKSIYSAYGGPGVLDAFRSDPLYLSYTLVTDNGEDSIVDYTTNVDLRKLQVRFQRTPVGGVIEDVDVCTFHFLKLNGATPDGTWLTADFTTAESAFDTWWTAVKPSYMPSIALGQYRWYKSGATWDVTPAPYNPAERITEKNTPGTATAGVGLPPQCAMSVTEKTASRPSWGRFYLPAPVASVVAAEGLINSTTVTALAAATVTLYNTMRTAHLLPVVFGRARGEYERKDGTVLPPKSARC
jgi:hypothetical protein